MASITLKSLTKRFGLTTALADVDLTIGNGEFFCLVGPSGCGKTTLLRLIAGFDSPDEGEIYFDDKAVTHLPCEKRGVAVVFQQYALWPHMTVEENLRFGLEAQRLPKKVQRERLDEALEMVQLTPLAARYPHELSGGQQQRVAVARALALHPKVILLDEPLSNLDPSLRLQVREEMKELQKELGITMVYVTHDHTEALSTAHRMAILRGGKLVQEGSPRELYSNPKDLFVATFLGELNSLRGVPHSRHSIEIDGTLFQTSKEIEGRAEIVIGIRPESLSLAPSLGSRSFRGEIKKLSFHGSTSVVTLKINDRTFISLLVTGSLTPSIGEQVEIHYQPSDIIVFNQ